MVIPQQVETHNFNLINKPNTWTIVGSSSRNKGKTPIGVVFVMGVFPLFLLYGSSHKQLLSNSGSI